MGSSSLHSILTRHKIIGTIGELQRTFSVLTAVKIHCSVLAEEAIKKAIEDYLAKKNA